MYQFGTKDLTALLYASTAGDQDAVDQRALELLTQTRGHSHFGIVANEVHRTVVSIVSTLCMSMTNELQLESGLIPYISALTQALPPLLKYPPAEFGILGAYEYLVAVLKPILTYKELRTECYSLLQEIGNAYAVVEVFDLAAVKGPFLQPNKRRTLLRVNSYRQSLRTIRHS